MQVEHCVRVVVVSVKFVIDPRIEELCEIAEEMSFGARDVSWIASYCSSVIPD